MAAEGITPFQCAVAWAMTSPVWVGAAANHTGGEAGPAETVYLGVYRREAIERAGGYDENMIKDVEWELNYRIRASGGLIWFTPELRVTYRPRANLRELARQHFCYGRWRRVVAAMLDSQPALPRGPRGDRGEPCRLCGGDCGTRALGGGAPPGLRWLTLGFAIPAVYAAGVAGAAAVLAATRRPRCGGGARRARSMHMCRAPASCAVRGAS